MKGYVRYIFAILFCKSKRGCSNNFPRGKFPPKPNPNHVLDSCTEPYFPMVGCRKSRFSQITSEVLRLSA